MQNKALSENTPSTYHHGDFKLAITFLFTETNVYPTFQCVTNPYKFETSNGIVIGTSGQNVDDVRKNCNLNDSLDVMEQMIRWSHIAPTCPDTLGCFPYPEGAKDPFILDCPPRIFFAGNQKELSFRKIETTVRTGEVFQTLLLALPSFMEKKKMALINLNDMECEELLFDTEFDSSKFSEKRSPSVKNSFTITQWLCLLM